jgi:hypothetical protein
MSTFYQSAPTLETLVLACLSPPLLITKFFLSLVYVFVQMLISTIVKPSAAPVLDSGIWDGEVGKEKHEQRGAKLPAGARAEAGISPFGGTTITITVSAGAYRLAVVTVTIAALTSLAIPFLPSAPSFFALFNRFGGSGTISSSGVGDSSGLGVDIKMCGVSR